MRVNVAKLVMWRPPSEWKYSLSAITYESIAIGGVNRDWWSSRMHSKPLCVTTRRLDRGVVSSCYCETQPFRKSQVFTAWVSRT